MRIAIGEASLDDAGALADLKREVEGPLYEDYGTPVEHEADMNRFTSVAHVATMVGDPGVRVLFAGDRRSPSGMVALRREDGAPFLFSLAVRSRGQGVGTALLYVSLCGEGAATEIFCESFGQNAKAITFFSRFGFAKVGSRPSGSYNRQILLRLRASLPEAREAAHRRLEELGVAVDRRP